MQISKIEFLVFLTFRLIFYFSVLWIHVCNKESINHSIENIRCQIFTWNVCSLILNKCHSKQCFSVLKSSTLCKNSTHELMFIRFIIRRFKGNKKNNIDTTIFFNARLQDFYTFQIICFYNYPFFVIYTITNRVTINTLAVIEFASCKASEGMSSQSHFHPEIPKCLTLLRLLPIMIINNTLMIWN